MPQSFKISNVSSILELQRHTNKNMKADDRIIFRLPSSLKSEFTQKIDRLGKKQAETLIEMVQKFVEEPDEPSEVQVLKQQMSAMQEEISKIKEQQKEYVGK